MTVDPARFTDHLRQRGIELFTGVPDSLLANLCSYVMRALPREQHIIAANEGAAVGIAMGHYLRTATPALVYLQNSGTGNTVNPLLSLADPDVYGIPMVLLIGWRGRPGVADEPQHVKQGRVMGALLDALEVPWTVLADTDDDAAKQATDAIDQATARSGPVALLVEKGTFAPDSGAATADESSGAAGETDDRPSRAEALAAAVEQIGDGAVHIATTGMLGRELFEYRQRPGVDDPGTDFLTVGGMGHACSIALGVAKHEPDREVWCLDGDGAALMHLGSLAVIADHGPSTLFHVVFNNGVHDSVGGQPTSIGVVDVPALAMAVGYRRAISASRLDEIGPAVAQLRAAGGPGLLELRVRPGNQPGIGRPTRTPAEAKQTFMTALK